MRIRGLVAAGGDVVLRLRLRVLPLLAQFRKGRDLVLLLLEVEVVDLLFSEVDDAARLAAGTGRSNVGKSSLLNALTNRKTLARTSHTISNVLALEPPTASTMRLRAAWNCQVLFIRAKEQHVFFGSSEYELRATDDGWVIAKKKVILQNDLIPTMLDIYCV